VLDGKLAYESWYEDRSPPGRTGVDMAINTDLLSAPDTFSTQRSLSYFSNSTKVTTPTKTTYPPAMSLLDILNEVRQTNVTKTTHQKPYDAISLTRPELNQAGKTILITGGGTGVGLAIAKAFIGASAATVIIVGRRAAVLETARVTLEDEAKATGTGTTIVARTCDISNMSDVNALWQYFSEQNILVDVYVANAAVISEPSTMMDIGADKVWEIMEINAKSCLYFAEKFYKQPGDSQKVSSSSFLAVASE
jgi:hypothetical protein